jgi:hypothetical protein
MAPFKKPETNSNEVHPLLTRHKASLFVIVVAIAALASYVFLINKMDEVEEVSTAGEQDRLASLYVERAQVTPEERQEIMLDLAN